MATHATQCLSLVKGRRIRVTRLDSCGRPVYGEASSVVSKGFISVAFTANTSESDEISVTNAAGEVCVYEAPVTSLTGYGLEIQFCNVDPELFALITGQNVVTGFGTTVVGFDVDTKISLANSNFALELWAGSPTGDACAVQGATGQYGYLLLPFLRGGILGDFTVENGAVTFTITGANTKEGNAWGVGPYKDVMLSVAGVSEVQGIQTSGAPTGGTFTLTYNGFTTGTIVYNASAAVIKTALEAIPGIALGDITTSGGPLPAVVTVTFGGNLAGQDISALTATASLTGGTTPTVIISTSTPGLPRSAGAMVTPVSTSVALRTMVVDLAPPEAGCGTRPLLNPTLASLTSLAAVKGVDTYEAAFTTTPAATSAVYYDFGDGTWDYVSAPGTTSHQYAAVGTYTARVNQNGQWRSTTVTIPYP